MSLESCVADLQRRGLSLRLQLGCGSNILPNWINTDAEARPGVEALDFTKRLPFHDATIDAVFCEHTIEHVTKPEAVQMMGEVRRVLRPGGAFRVVTPSLEKICRLAIHPATGEAQRYLAFFRTYCRNPHATLSDAVNMMFYGHGHRHLYMRDELADLLRAVAFGNVVDMLPGSYRGAVFNNVDGHGKVIGDDINSIESMAFEANRLT